MYHTLKNMVLPSWQSTASMAQPLLACMTNYSYFTPEPWCWGALARIMACDVVTPPVSTSLSPPHYGQWCLRFVLYESPATQCNAILSRVLFFGTFCFAVVNLNPSTFCPISSWEHPFFPESFPPALLPILFPGAQQDAHTVCPWCWHHLTSLTEAALCPCPSTLWRLGVASYLPWFVANAPHSHPYSSAFQLPLHANPSTHSNHPHLACWLSSLV